MQYTTPPADHAELKQRLLDNADAVMEALIDGLAACGSEDDWDSETIENLLNPIDGYLREQLAVPGVGSNGPDDVNTKFWCEVGGYDYAEMYGEE